MQLQTENFSPSMLMNARRFLAKSHPSVCCHVNRKIRADFDSMYGRDGLPWGAVQGLRSAVWLAQTSDEQRRNAPQGSPSLRVKTKCGPCVATPSGHPHLASTRPYIESKSALNRRP